MAERSAMRGREREEVREEGKAAVAAAAVEAAAAEARAAILSLGFLKMPDSMGYILGLLSLFFGVGGEGGVDNTCWDSAVCRVGRGKGEIGDSRCCSIKRILRLYQTVFSALTQVVHLSRKQKRNGNKAIKRDISKPSMAGDEW